MAFLKSSQITGLSAKDVDVRGFTQAANIKLGERAYTEHEVLLADSYSIVGDVTVSEDLVLSKLSDDGDPITVTGDTTTRTISGSGSISGATMAQTPNARLTGMSGTVGSGDFHGAGISYMENSILTNVTIKNNRTTSGHGGGIYCYVGGGNTFENVTIKNNHALFGGGIGLYGDNVDINFSDTDNDFKDNCLGS